MAVQTAALMGHHWVALMGLNLETLMGVDLVAKKGYVMVVRWAVKMAAVRAVQRDYSSVSSKAKWKAVYLAAKKEKRKVAY